ncbi:Uncharacterized protein FWK35_00034580 [Aphis craccivora]|uniref:Uncharacterized protein n=1 Tax=Aphis craccivora TaxID=307492 RepID=A0A6G0XKK6_APHCR|nr:Uncharacterized protein FWK35_00034580 [Aphis craccivora]
MFSCSNIIIQQQPIITKQEIQDFFKPAEQIYDFDGKYIIYKFITLFELLKSQASKHLIKFNLKLEATFNIRNVDNSSENRSFKTSARPIFSETGVREIVEEGIIKLMAE